MDARQRDVVLLAAALYSTHLDDGSWTRHDGQGCARLPLHRFALFTQAPAGGAIRRFFAVYDLNATPQHSAKPWQRGALLLRLSPSPDKGLGAGTSDANLLAVFNRVLQDEHASGPNVPVAARISIDDLAECFLAATGEQRIPADRPTSPGQQQALNHPAASGAMTGIMVPLVSPAGYTRSENIRVDEHGLLTRADVLVQYTAR